MAFFGKLPKSEPRQKQVSGINFSQRIFPFVEITHHFTHIAYWNKWAGNTANCCQAQLCGEVLQCRHRLEDATIVYGSLPLPSFSLHCFIGSNKLTHERQTFDLFALMGHARTGDPSFSIFSSLIRIIPLRFLEAIIQSSHENHRHAKISLPMEIIRSGRWLHRRLAFHVSRAHRDAPRGMPVSEKELFNRVMLSGLFFTHIPLPPWP